MSPHFALRVNERIGTVDPATLSDCLHRAVTEGRSDYVEFVSRVSRNGLRLFRFRVPDGRLFYAIINDKHWPLTVLPPGFTVRREGKPTLQLEDCA